MVIRSPDKPVIMSEERRICKSALRRTPFTRLKNRGDFTTLGGVLSNQDAG